MFDQIGLSGAWNWFRIQGQLLRDLFRGQDLYAILTESSGCLLQIRLRVRECLGGRFQILGRRTHFAEGFFHPTRCVQNEHAKLERADNKRMRLELGKEDTDALSYVEGFFSNIDVELSFKHVEEFILTRMHMGGGSFPGAKVASNKEKVPLVSFFSTRFVSKIPMYYVDSSSDVVRLNVRNCDSV